MKFKSRVKKSLRFVIATLLLACVALLFLDLTGLLDSDEVSGRAVPEGAERPNVGSSS